MAFTVGGLDNWYDQNMKQGIELMSAYIEEVESARSAALDAYHKYKKVDVEPIDEFHAVIITSFRNLESTTFDLEDIYKNYFPNQSRHACLVTVISMFEKRIFELCKALHREAQVTTDILKAIKNKNGKLVGMQKFLHEKIKLPRSSELELHWTNLRSLNLIRNNIVHNFGVYEAKKELVDSYIQKNPNITVEKETREFIFNHQFLVHLIPFFNLFSESLQKAIRTR